MRVSLVFRNLYRFLLLGSMQVFVLKQLFFFSNGSLSIGGLLTGFIAFLVNHMFVTNGVIKFMP